MYATDVKLIDTHTHLDIIAEKGKEPFEVLCAAADVGVSHVVQIATDLDNSHWNRKLAAQIADLRQQQPNTPLAELYWCAGVHPESIGSRFDKGEFRDFLAEAVEDHHFSAIGEIGLDYFHSSDNRREQRQLFAFFLEQAIELKAPVVLHLRDDRSYNRDKRDAWRDALAMVREYEGVHGVLHCYTYSPEEAWPFVELGWRVSYSGIVTYKNGQTLQQGAAKLPLSTLMVETDAPFLAPAPERGKRNEPALLPHTLDFLARHRAEISGETIEEICSAIYDNSLAFIHHRTRTRETICSN